MTSDAIRRGRTAPFARVAEWVVAADLSPQAKALYVVLTAHENVARGDAKVWPGMTLCASLLGLKNRQSLTRYVKELQAVGAIDVEVERHPGGRRNIYTVHETPPAGYTGPGTLSEFHQRWREQADSTTQDSGTEPGSTTQSGGTPPDSGTQSGGTGQGGGNPEVATHRNPQHAMGGNPQVARTRRTQPDEGNQTNCTSSGGNSVEGTPVGACADAHAAESKTKPRGGRISARSLLGLDDPALTKRLVSVWSAVVLENGGELPVQDSGGWEPDGYPVERGKHPAGAQLKAWFEDNDDRSLSVLGDILDRVRVHAAHWAGKHPARTADAA